jgi:Flp pilus assembly protein TadG
MTQATCRPSAYFLRMTRRLSLRVRAFARERSAVSAVEFAMIAPLLVLLIIETIQIAFYFYTSAALNNATNYAARQIRVGNVANGNQTFAQFQTSLCGQLPATMSCPANLVINVYDVPEGTGTGQGFTTYLNASQTAIVQPSPMSSTTFCPGSPASNTPGSTNYGIYVQVYYAMPLFSPIWLALAAQNGQTFNGKSVHFVPASAAFRNEPYVGGQDTKAAC